MKKGRLIFSGDTHGNIDLGKLNQSNIKKFLDSINEPNLNENDTIIVTGDFGLVWFNENHYKIKQDTYWQKWLIKKGCTIAFVDGNHENHEMLDNLPTEEKWGGLVGIVNVYNETKEIIDGKKVIVKTKIGEIYHLKRGEIYTINNKKILTIGGAQSQDKQHRKEFIDWWSREELSMSEQYHTMDNLDKHNWEVDYVITHTCPSEVGYKIAEKYWVGPYGDTSKYQRLLDKSIDTTSKFFDMLISNGLKFKEWHFGHWHEDCVIYPHSDKKYFCHYKNLMIGQV